MVQNMKQLMHSFGRMMDRGIEAIGTQKREHRARTATVATSVTALAMFGAMAIDPAAREHVRTEAAILHGNASETIRQLGCIVTTGEACPLPTTGPEIFDYIDDGSRSESIPMPQIASDTQQPKLA
jgi:uncharacterized Ntn-hydrolase superfamily protein